MNDGLATEIVSAVWERLKNSDLLLTRGRDDVDICCQYQLCVMQVEQMLDDHEGMKDLIDED